MVALLLAVCAALASGAAAPGARAQIAVSAFADKTVVAEGETVLLRVEVTGARDVQTPTPPRASRHLELVSVVPALRQRTTFGAQTRLVLGWRYRAVATGSARLDGTRVRADGQAFSTDPISIRVTPRGAPAAIGPAPGAGRAPASGARGAALVVRAEPRTRRVVVGQQVVVDYVLYFDPEAVSPRQAVAVGTWDATGFWREEMDVPTASTYPRPATLGGRPMQAVTIRRLALFPARAGTLDLAPMEYEIEAREAEPRDAFDAFFSPFRSRRVDRRVTAPAAAIEVRPLPPGAPPSFSGAVGSFTLGARVAPEAAAPGEAVTLEVTLRGTGNAATFAAPEIEAPPGVDAYAPQSERRTETARAPLVGTRTLRYTFVPQGGSFEVPAVAWSYYDPEAGAYRTLTGGPWPVAVSGAPAVASSAATSPARGARWRRASGLPTAPLWALLGVGVALPAAAALGLAGARRRRQRPRPAPTADPAARLRAAADRPPRERAAEAERAVREAAALRIGPEALALPRRDIAARLAGAAPEASGHAACAVADVLARCERARFAHAPDPTLAADALAAVQALTP